MMMTDEAGDWHALLGVLERGLDRVELLLDLSLALGDVALALLELLAQFGGLGALLFVGLLIFDELRELAVRLLLLALELEPFLRERRLQRLHLLVRVADALQADRHVVLLLLELAALLREQLDEVVDQICSSQYTSTRTRTFDLLIIYL